jgi:phosphotransferase system HPr-like phosphotransfer protein
MRYFSIQLKAINDVKEFVNIVSTFDCDIDLTSDRYVVDGKSIMGLFSLDLSRPIKVSAHCDDPSIAEKLKKFIVD